MTAARRPPKNGKTARFSVLFVCTANQARSPMSVLLLDAALKEMNIRWQVTSAGIDAVSGSSIHPLAVEALAEIGVEAEQTRSRQIAAELIDSADLILTAETRHRHEVVTRNVGALNKAFTLVQFARYTTLVALETTSRRDLGPDLLAGATIARSRFQPALDGGDDIADPVGGHLRDFAATRDQIKRAVDQIVVPLAGSPAIGGPVTGRVDLSTGSGDGGGTASAAGHGEGSRKSLIRRLTGRNR